MNLLSKRILAGSFDLLLLSFAIKLLSLLNVATEVAALIIYCAILSRYQTTFGGVVLGLKTVSLDGNQELNTSQPIIKALLMWGILIVYGLLIAKIGFSPTNSAYIGFSLLAVNIAPVFLTKNQLMLHDIISGTYVLFDDRNIFSHKVKYYFNLTFMMLTICIIVVFYSGH